MNPSNESSDPEPPNLSGVRILIVEDSWQISMAMTSLLEELGAEVSGPVATSADALRLACEHLPDAALVDFNLRGGELADGLIALLHELGIYVVVATGYTELPTVSSHVTILHKPVSLAALLGGLRPMIARKAHGRS
jgi:CheY-like chemotaxis protein